MSTKIFFYDSNKTPTNIITLDDSVKNFDYPVTFIGRGTPAPYGSEFQTSVLKLLENGSSDIRPVNSVEGQTWYDENSSSLKVSRVTQEYTTTTNEVRNWFAVGAPIYSSTPPGGSSTSLWFDQVEQQLKYFDSSWISVADSYLLLTGGDVVGDLSFTGNNIFVATGGDVVNNNVLIVDDPSTLLDMQVAQGTVFDSDTGKFTFTITPVGERFPSYSSLESIGGIFINYNSDGSSPSEPFSIKFSGTEVLNLNDVLTVTVPINFQSNKATNARAPVDTTDAARYDELSIVQALYDQKITAAGDTMTGTLIVNGDVNLTDQMTTASTTERKSFTLDNGGTPSEFFDTNTSLIIKDGTETRATFDGNGITLANVAGGASLVQNVAAPVGSSDYTNKTYVDGLEAGHLASLAGVYDPNATIKAWIVFFTNGTSVVVEDSYNTEVVAIASSQLSITFNSDNIWALPPSEFHPCTIVGSTTIDSAFNSSYSFNNYNSVVVDRTARTFDGFGGYVETLQFSYRSLTEVVQSGRDDWAFIARYNTTMGLPTSRRFAIVATW